MDPLAPLIDALHAEGRPRVWSLVMTVFGDSVEPRGGRIATARLRALLGRIGVEEGALRTALSRLASDGWVSSERSGRSSHYSLTSRGRTEAAAATTRIYRAPKPGDSDRTAWTMGFGLPAPRDAILLGGETWIAPGDDTPGTAALARVTGQLTRTDALAARIVADPHMDALLALRADLHTLARLDTPDPLSAAAARTLLVHRWRRMVLRYPELPDDLVPEGHPAHGLRPEVARIYRRLCGAAEPWFDEPGDGFGAMPAADAAIDARFTRA